eukprot:TRINITY_DN13548_c0_g1_i3.p1 TRINITY_DN13548_c0_g1~~TRINITY_DN13548_c0_g1_i3.p1  ORF type:complete len:280 (-),score=20.46 TRINITY_DN13548_c0_g1_i3:140-958(-)
MHLFVINGYFIGVISRGNFCLLNRQRLLLNFTFVSVQLQNMHTRLFANTHKLRQNSKLQCSKFTTIDNSKSYGKVDLVLSSGFMAFAAHAGFLEAVVKADLQVEGVMGTSSGAYAGSLFCAGYSPEQIAHELCHIPPYKLLGLSQAPWKGGWMSLENVIKRLKDLLPPTFEDLNVDFACSVVDYRGNYMLVDSGPLPEAIAASGAIPFMFEPVQIPGMKGIGPYFDGGVYDRVGLEIWRNQRRQRNGGLQTNHALVHIVERSTLSGKDDLRE